MILFLDFVLRNILCLLWESVKNKSYNRYIQLTSEIIISDKTVEMLGHTNPNLSNIGYSSALRHKTHHGRGIEFCTILFDKRLSFSSDEVTEKHTPRFVKYSSTLNIFV